MLKKLIILLVVILILGAAVVFCSIAGVVPWFVTRSVQSTTSVDTYDAVQTATSTLPATLVPTGVPATPALIPNPGHRAIGSGTHLLCTGGTYPLCIHARSCQSFGENEVRSADIRPLVWYTRGLHSLLPGCNHCSPLARWANTGLVASRQHHPAAADI